MISQHVFDLAAMIHGCIPFIAGTTISAIGVWSLLKFFVID